MASTATNRTAALAGAWSALGIFAYSASYEYLLPLHELLRWWINLFVLGFVFFVPFFKYVIGTDFKFNGEGLELREEWLAMAEKRSRLGFWALSACTVGALLGFATRLLFR